MKFRFRYDTVMRQRKVEQDVAQRDFAEAQQAVRDQLAKIKSMYSEMDMTRVRIEEVQARGGNCLSELNHLEDFIKGQKIRIEMARKFARELMQIEEEKQEILVERVRAFKVLEKLKEKRFEEFRKLKNKKQTKELNDLVTMRFKSGV